MNDNTIVGSDTAPVVEQADNSTSVDKVNPGSIRKSTTSTILNALSQASGQQFDSVEAAIAYMARTSNNRSGGNVQPVEVAQQESRMGREVGNDNTDLREQFSKLQRDLASKERALRQKELDTEILRNMGDRFDPDLQDYALQKVKSNIQWKRDGTYSIVNNKGQERYGLDGNPLSIQGLLEEVAKGNPKLLKQNNLSSGSGLKPGQTQFAGAPTDMIPDYSKDPAAFDAWAQKMGLGKGIGLKGVKVGASVSASTKKIL